jgi:hypothetical protein
VLLANMSFLAGYRRPSVIDGRLALRVLAAGGGRPVRRSSGRPTRPRSWSGLRCCTFFGPERWSPTWGGPPSTPGEGLVPVGGGKFLVPGA